MKLITIEIALSVAIELEQLIDKETDLSETMDALLLHLHELIEEATE
jgi:hypothetical protein